MKKRLPLLLLIAASSGMLYWYWTKPSPQKLDNKTTSLAPEALHQHSETFRKRVEKVTDGVYVAIGYGLANSILLEGEDGVVIVDCMESEEAAAEVLAEFRKITDKPVKAIIYTHNHADHIFGAQIMADGGKPVVYSHELTGHYIDRIVSELRYITEKRGYRMFGLYLDEAGLVNCGIGPRLQYNADTKLGILRPTHTFRDSMKVSVAGIDIELVHAPGETNDQLFVWLPDKEVLLCGDNLYKTFPNLYTIRGTPYRDVKEWYRSLDKMRYKRPAYLVPSHTEPLAGVDTIQRVLRDYRDGIQYVHDQTIRHINKGLTTEEIVELVQLPPHLSQSPYLQEFYGKVSWSVRSIFDGNLGFFNGNPSQLQPLPTMEKAEKMAELAGDYSALLQQADKALNNKEFQWALELTDHLLVLKSDDKNAQDIRYNCLIALGEAEGNPNARHYYLTTALELRGLKNEALIQPTPAMVREIPLSSVFRSLPVFLDAQKSLEVNMIAEFRFTDSEEVWSVQVRQGVAEVQPFALPSPDLVIRVEEQVWKELAAKIRGGAATWAAGDLKVEPGIGELVAFLGLFDF